jgi:hypothetical protein
MRPGALTPAARSAASRQDGASPRVTDRPRAARTVREAPGDRSASRSPRPPRRVSGPAKGKPYASRKQSAGRPTSQASAGRSTRQTSATRARSGAGATRTTSAARSFLPARVPRGIFASGSAAVAAAVALPLRRPFLDREPTPRRAPKPVPAPRPDTSAKPATGILHRIGAFVVSLPDHLLLDRVVRGRAWIPLLGVLLAGIVAAQVEILKLGASMGRSLEQTTTLTSQNELLRDSVASLSDDQRIERLATSMGMVLPPPGAVGYLTASQRGDVTGALNNIHAPNAAAFIALTPSNGALVTGPGTSMLPTSSGLLAQAGTPGSATPTTTPSATSTVAPTGTAASSGTAAGTSATAAGGTGATTGSIGATTGSTGTTTGSTGTTTGGSATPTGTTSSQTTPAEEPPPATTTTPATSPTDSQGATTGTQSSPTDSQTPATGAAAIQPAGNTQQSSGG